MAVCKVSREELVMCGWDIRQHLDWAIIQLQLARKMVDQRRFDPADQKVLEDFLDSAAVRVHDAWAIVTGNKPWGRGDDHG